MIFKPAMVSLLVLALCAGAQGQIVPDFDAVPISGQNPLTVSFTDQTTGASPIFWLWDFGDGGASNAQNPVHTYLAPGSYTVSLTAIESTSAFGTATKRDFISVAPAPLVPNFVATPTTGALPLTVSFSDQSSGVAPTSWVWDFGDGGTSADQNPSHTYLAIGSYTVTLTAFFHQQTATLVSTDLITVVPAPLVADFNATPLSGVNPLQVSFTDTSHGATTTAWSWDFGDGASSTVQNPTHTYTAPGHYDVSLTAFVLQQAETTVKTGLISVAPAPLVTAFTADPLSGSNPLKVSFLDQSVGATVTAWLWDFGDGSQSRLQNPRHTYTAVGDHTVSLTAFVGQQGETAVQAQFIHVDPAPLVVGIAASPKLGHAPLWVNFSDQSSGAPVTAWAWDFGDGFGANIQNPKHQFVAPGSYTVTLTVSVGQQTGTLVQQGLVTVLPPLYPVTAEVFASDAGIGDRFGHSVSLSADRLLTGAIFQDTVGTNSGAAYIHELAADGSWTELTRLLASDRTAGDQFGNSVAISGSRAVIGAPFHEHDGAFDQGSAYIFEHKPGLLWREVAELRSPHLNNNTHFGRAVALENDTVAVGGEAQGLKAGTAWVFERGASGGWDEVAKLQAGDEAAGDRFGMAVAMSSGYLLVGAPQESHGGIGAGAAYVFKRSAEGQWLQQARLAPTDVGMGAQFGAAVSLSGSRAVIGSPGHRSFKGAAYVFDRQPDGTWEQTALLVIADPTSFDMLGTDVSIRGDDALIGATGTDSLVYGTNSGSAYLFRRQPNGDWSQLAQLLSSDGKANDELGVAVSLAAGRLAIGARKHDHAGGDAGAVYIYEAASGSLLLETLPADSATPTATLSLVLRGAPPGSWVQLLMALPDDSSAAPEGRHKTPLPSVSIVTMRADADGEVTLPLASGGDTLAPCRLQAVVPENGALQWSNVLKLPGDS